ncbi:MAG: putative rane protein [Armatimonadetes bacterium]|jgi:ABC-2 type transport system permease protein|nr:putative rane protein [Armatimonadota bacterium]
MDSLRVYYRCVLASIRAQLQYRASFIMSTLGQFLMIGLELAAVGMLFARFGTLRGWTLPEVVLLFGMANVAFALGESTGRGFDTFAAQVKSGDFDRLLLRPRGTAFQVAAQEVQLMRVGRLFQGVIALVWAAPALHLSWHDPRWLTVAAGILGGAAVFYGLFVLQAALAFWTVESLEVMNTVTYGGVETAQYPMSIYRPGFRQFFTLVVPLGAVIYLPAKAVLHGAVASHPGVWSIFPVAVGIAFLAVALLVWEVGVRHYRSTGS